MNPVEVAKVSNIKPVTPEEAKQLLDEGWVYVDVRSEPEFEQGHVPGALNVPLMHMGAGGMSPNPEFLSVMQAAFGTGEKLLIGCRSGGRSRRAAEMLAQHGYQELADLSTGFDASRDAFGRAVEGWSRKGLPVEQGAQPGQSYASVKQRKPA